MGEYTILSIQVYGLAVIISLLVAVVIRVVVSLLSALEKKTDHVAPITAAPAAAVSETRDEHIVAISAAVWAMIGSHRIVHIEPTGRGRVWTAGGRIAHHTSHSVEHRPKQWNQSSR